VTTAPRAIDEYGESLQLIFIEKHEADFLKQLVDEFNF